MLIPNGVSDEFPAYFISKNSKINKSNMRKSFGKKWFKLSDDTKELFWSKQSVENILRNHARTKVLQIKTLINEQNIKIKQQSISRMSPSNQNTFTSTFNLSNTISARGNHK